MANYREILRLSSLGINNKQIAEGMGIVRQTVVTALQRAAAQGLDWQTAAPPPSDRELAARLFPQQGADKPSYKLPDYESIHRELRDEIRQPALSFAVFDLHRWVRNSPYSLATNCSYSGQCDFLGNSSKLKKTVA